MSKPDGAVIAKLLQCVREGGVVVDPEWLRVQLEKLRVLSDLARDIRHAPTMMANTAVRVAVSNELGDGLDELRIAFKELSKSIPVRDALDIPPAQ